MKRRSFIQTAGGAALAGMASTILTMMLDGLTKKHKVSLRG